jgi:hypothetical protein
MYILKGYFFIIICFPRYKNNFHMLAAPPGEHPWVVVTHPDVVLKMEG